MKKLLLCLLVASCFIGFSKEKTRTKKKSATVTAPTAPGTIGCKAPDLSSLTYVKGKPIVYKKNVVYVIEFWGIRCPPCIAMMPKLTSIQQMYGKKDLVILGLHAQGGTVEDLAKFVKSKGSAIDYHIAMAGGEAEKLMYQFKQNGLPYAFIVKNERVIWHGRPQTIGDEIAKHVRRRKK